VKQKYNYFYIAAGCRKVNSLRNVTLFMAKFRKRSVEKKQNQRLIYWKVREMNRLWPNETIIQHLLGETEENMGRLLERQHTNNKYQNYLICYLQLH
jgi:hypothetical protein